MIVRILGEGQFELAEEHVEELNRLDAAVESAVDAGNENAFGPALAALLDAVRRYGSVPPPDFLHDSDQILPPADATLDEVRGMLDEDGLIPG